jgi:hypothetical protein
MSVASVTTAIAIAGLLAACSSRTQQQVAKEHESVVRSQDFFKGQQQAVRTARIPDSKTIQSSSERRTR